MTQALCKFFQDARICITEPFRAVMLRLYTSTYPDILKKNFSVLLMYLNIGYSVKGPSTKGPTPKQALKRSIWRLFIKRNIEWMA